MALALPAFLGQLLLSEAVLAFLARFLLGGSIE